MDIADFHASRRFAEVKSGRIAYFEQGQGPVAFFVHGVPVNGYHWRHVIDRVKHRRPCFAIHLMGLGYADPGIPTDEFIRLYLQPLLSSPQRIDAFQRYWLGFDNAQTVAIHGALKTLRVPTLIVWGLKDIFFDKKWAYWLKDTIPGAGRVVEVEDARLFFPEDRPDALAAPVLDFWDEWSLP